MTEMNAGDTGDLDQAHQKIETLRSDLRKLHAEVAAWRAASKYGQDAPLLVPLLVEATRTKFDNRGRPQFEIVGERGRVRDGMTVDKLVDELRQRFSHVFERDGSGGTEAPARNDDADANWTETARRIADSTKTAELAEIRQKARAANPFARSTGNVTLAGRVLKLDPEMARRLRAEAAHDPAPW